MNSGQVRLLLAALLVSAGVCVTAPGRAQEKAPSSKPANVPTDSSARGSPATAGLAYFTPGFTTTLVAVEEVQKELRLSPEQKAKVNELYEKLKAGVSLPSQKDLQRLSVEERGRRIAESMQQRTELAQQLREQVYSVLDEAQGRRLKELILQRRGPSVLLDERVCSQLEVTPEQKEKMRVALTNDRGRVLTTFNSPAGDMPTLTPQERAKRVDDTRKVTEAKMLEALTAQQREMFEKLRGVKFDFPASMTITNDWPSSSGGSSFAVPFSPFPALGSPFNLIASEAVQKELQLSDDQKKNSTELAGKLRTGVSFPRREELQKFTPDEQRKKYDESVQKRNELEKQLQKQLYGLLNETQARRLKGLSVQRRGLTALLDDEIGSELALTAKQKATIKAALAIPSNRSSSLPDERSTSPQSLSSAEREKQVSDWRTKSDEQKKATEAKAMNVLTAEQKAKLEKLKGGPFDFSRRSDRGGSRPSSGKSRGGAKP
ncbi:MAG: hypothetical protein HZA46_00740 [Planctomycetales bacterium]|nr:hypothetical protein [Planctomycetales bacterium]